jgi:hypothetical protein
VTCDGARPRNPRRSQGSLVGLRHGESAECPRPSDWRYHAAVKFDVEFDVTPLEQGRLGHLGIAAWRLRVDDWVSVTPFQAVRDPRRSPRRDAISMVPLFGVVAALALAVLTGLSLPHSSSPAQGPAVRSVVVWWVVAVALMSAGAWWGALLASRRARWAAAVLVIAVLGGVGVWVARRFDLAWVDSCWYGTGSGDRCLASDGSAPTAVIIVWPLAALLLGATVGLGPAIASSAAPRRDASDA